MLATIDFSALATSLSTGFCLYGLGMAGIMWAALTAWLCSVAAQEARMLAFVAACSLPDAQSRAISTPVILARLSVSAPVVAPPPAPSPLRMVIRPDPCHVQGKALYTVRTARDGRPYLVRQLTGQRAQIVAWGRRGENALLQALALHLG